MKRNTISLEFRRSIAHCSSSHGEGQTPSLDWRGVGTRSLGAAHADPGTPNRTQSTVCDARTGQSAGSQHPDHWRAHRHALAIEGHTGLQRRCGTRLELRSRKHERSALTSAASVHTVRRALRRILGSCGAAREAHRQYGWMDARLTTGARRAPAGISSMAQSSCAATVPPIGDEPATGRLSAVDWAGVRRVWWAQEQLAQTCPSTRCRTQWDSHFASLLELLRGGAQPTKGRTS